MGNSFKINLLKGNLKVTLPRKIRSIKQKIEADFKAVEDEVVASWYNGLSASAKRTYDNVVEMVGEGEDGEYKMITFAADFRLHLTSSNYPKDGELHNKRKGPLNMLKRLLHLTMPY